MALFRHTPSDGIQVAWSIHSNCNGRFLNASSKYETSGSDILDARTGALIVGYLINLGADFGQPDLEQRVTADRLMYINHFLIYNESNRRIFFVD